MSIRSFFCVLAILCVHLLIAQEELSMEYAAHIADGKECLMEGGQDCQEHFDLALDFARETQNDSVICSVYLETYNAMKIAGGEFDLLKGILRQGLDFAGIKNSYHRAFFYAEMGNTILDYGRQEDYMAYYDSAATFIMQTDNRWGKSQVLVARARGLEVDGRLDESIRELLKAREHAEGLGNPVGLAQIAMGLSNVYYMNSDFALAKEQLAYGANLVREAGDTLRYHYAMTNWCNVCLSMDEPEEVIDVLPEAIEFFRKSGHEGLTPYPMTQLGRAYEMLGRPEKAIPILQESIDLSSELGIETQLAYNHQIIAHAYEAIGARKEALEHSSLAYEHYKSRGESTEFMDASETHAEMLELNGRHMESLAVYKEYVQVKDSVYTADKMKEVAQIQGLLELEQKENMLCAQENEITHLEEEKRLSKIRNIALGIGLLLAALIAWLLVKSKNAQVRLKESENRQLEMTNQHQKRELASKALHLAQKNEFLLGLKAELEESRKQGEDVSVHELVTKLKFEKQVDQNWDQFMSAFKESSPELLKKLNESHPDLTKKEVQLCALARMGLSIKEAASMLNVSPDAVKKARYRLRKKLGLDTADSLEKYLQDLLH